MILQFDQVNARQRFRLHALPLMVTFIINPIGTPISMELKKRALLHILRIFPVLSFPPPRFRLLLETSSRGGGVLGDGSETRSWLGVVARPLVGFPTETYAEMIVNTLGEPSVQFQAPPPLPHAPQANQPSWRGCDSPYCCGVHATVSSVGGSSEGSVLSRFLAGASMSFASCSMACNKQGESQPNT